MNITNIIPIINNNIEELNTELLIYQTIQETSRQLTFYYVVVLIMGVVLGVFLTNLYFKFIKKKVRKL